MAHFRLPQWSVSLLKHGVIASAAFIVAITGIATSAMSKSAYENMMRQRAAGQSAGQSVGQSAGQSVGQSVGQSAGQSAGAAGVHVRPTGEDPCVAKSDAALKFSDGPNMTDVKAARHDDIPRISRTSGPTSLDLLKVMCALFHLIVVVPAIVLFVLGVAFELYDMLFPFVISLNIGSCLHVILFGLVRSSMEPNLNKTYAYTSVSMVTLAIAPIILSCLVMPQYEADMEDAFWRRWLVFIHRTRRRRA